MASEFSMQKPSTIFYNVHALCHKIILNRRDIFFAISVFTLIYYLWILAKYSKKHRYTLPPGPRGLPVVGSLPFLGSELHSHFADMARTYGPILSLKLGGKTSIVISSPEMARAVLKENDVTFANRPVPAVVTGGRDIVFTPYGPEWRMLRKVCVRDMLGHATLDAFYCYRRQEVRKIVKYLHGLKGCCTVNVGELMFSSVLNVITSMLWGGTVEGDERAVVGAEFRQVVGEITELLGKANVSDFFPCLAWLDLQGLKKQMKVVIAKLECIFEKIIEEGLQEEGDYSGSNSKDDLGRASNFLQVLLQLRDAGDTEIPLTMMHIKALLVDMVVGGTDTTSSTVEFAIAEMMNRPEVMLEAQLELDTVVGKDRAVEESHIGKLPYLNAVMKEVLRLHPVIPLMVPHCPSKPCVVAGYSVPKGAHTFVNVWAIHRDPGNWTNPNEFVPGRFLNGEGEWNSDFSYLPFGWGRRSCAGMVMAERIVMYSLATLVHSFSWELGEGESLDLSEKFGIVLKKKVPLVAIPVPRLSGVDRSL